MSYTEKKHVETLENKKALFLDTETTGLVKNIEKNTKPENNYPPYDNLTEYDNARMIQIAYKLYEKYDYKDPNIDEIQTKYVKPNGFEIKNSNIHGITNEFAEEKGEDIKDVLTEIGQQIMYADYIIGYNPYFDINILLSEFNRLEMKEPINKIIKLKAEQKILCGGQLSVKTSLYVQSKIWQMNKKYKYQIPKQKDVYKKLFNTDLQNIHNAQYDVYALIRIINKIYVI